MLATTELQKILPTILSRCQLFEFRRVTPREVTAHLQQVCRSEGVTVPEAVLERIARAGEGSVRDSLSLLERVLAFGGESVTEEEALSILGAVRTEVLSRWIEGLAGRDAAGMLSVLDGLVDEGHDLLHVWAELLGALRDLLLLRTLPERAEILSRSPAEAAAIEKAAHGLSREDLKRAFQVVAELKYGLKGSSQPRFLFESALIRLADLGSVQPIEQILVDLGRTEHSIPRAPAPIPQKKKQPESIAAAEHPATRSIASGDFRSRLHATKPMLDAILDHASEVVFDGAQLRVSFAPSLDSVRRQVERPENLRALEEVAAGIAGGRVQVKISSVSAAAPPAMPASIDEPEPPPVSIGTSRAGDRELLVESAKKEPGVARLLAEFGAQIVDIRAVEAVAEPGLEALAEESS